ncbi:hypothetical protein [Streptomyces sp. SAS_270]|uniref:hypothetical protein n=1 Tax=Streptomyces sp. SAS_270 TaxID=3412748 RepID=UPI00403C7552
MRDDSVLETLVDQGLFEGVGVGGDLAQQRDSGGVVVHGPGECRHRNRHAQRVNGRAALAARYLSSSLSRAAVAHLVLACCARRVLGQAGAG